MSGKNIVWRGSTELEVVKQNSLTAMRHHADEQIKKLKEHANLLVKQAQELDERVKLAEKLLRPNAGLFQYILKNIICTKKKVN